MKAADLQMFGQKKKEPEKKAEESKKVVKKATKISRSKTSVRDGSVQSRSGSVCSGRDSIENIKDEEAEEMSIPEFDVEIVKTRRQFAPDKYNKMSSTKTITIKEGKSEAEAKAIYGAAGRVKVSTKEELKQSVGLDTKSSRSAAKPDKPFNLFKNKRMGSPKETLLMKYGPLEEKQNMLEPVL